MQSDEAKLVDALAAEAGLALDAAAELARGFARIWVTSTSPNVDRPEAFLLAWIAADELHVIAVGTKTNVRRMGLAERLVGKLLEFARMEGSRLVILEVRRSNAPALALYRKFGFAVSRLRRAYYSDPDEDGIEMQLHHDENGNIVPMPDEVPWLEVSECLR